MDGVSAINYGAIGNKDVDSETGIPYNYAMWDSYKEMTETALSKDWSEHFNTQESPIDYFQQLGKICVIPGTAWATPEYTTEISAVKEQCKQTIIDYSWRMVFAEDEDEFNSLLGEMQEISNGLGYEDVLKVDQENAAKRFEMFQEARAD